MIRKYGKYDKKLNMNLNAAMTFSIVGLIVAIIIMITDLTLIKIGKFDIYSSKDNFYFDAICYFFVLIFIPLGDITYIIKAKLFTPNIRETPFNNDKTNLLSNIICNFAEYYLLIFFLIICLISGDFSIGIYWARACGSMFLSHVFSWIATIFFIKNYKIIQVEYKQNPPLHIIEKNKIDEIKLKKQKDIENSKMYNELIQKCGFRFFIKYFEQVKNLPLKDISIEENIDTEDIEMRVKIIKKIIDNNLVHYCCENIKRGYGSYLSEEEKTLLDKMNKDNY